MKSLHMFDEPTEPASNWIIYLFIEKTV
jgi:hypothetical protein